MDRQGQEVERLKRSATWALREPLAPEEILPILRRLLRQVPPDSDDALFAHRHLAELGVESNPWEAALSARKLIQHQPDDDRAWAWLALSLTLLSHYRAAVHAYRKALAIAPNNPWYAHNLGHLLDVGLDHPDAGLPLLAAAHRREPQETEIASSYAHALGRVGRLEEARDLLRSSIRDGGNEDQRALLAWLDEATAECNPSPTPPPTTRRRSRGSTRGSRRRRHRTAR